MIYQPISASSLDDRTYIDAAFEIYSPVANAIGQTMNDDATVNNFVAQWVEFLNSIQHWQMSATFRGASRNLVIGGIIKGYASTHPTTQITHNPIAGKMWVVR